MRSAILLPLILLTLGACGGGEPCDFVGDMSAAAEIELRVLDAAGVASDVTDGARVPLILPPQGGKVIFAGVRARNLCAGITQILGYVRDGTTSTSPIVGLEGRPIRLIRGDDG
jgi:hypothetical protein